MGYSTHKYTASISVFDLLPTLDTVFHINLTYKTLAWTYLNEGHIADNHGETVVTVVKMTEVGMGRETGGQGHL